MGGSPHDDRVMAIALANQMRQYAFMPEFAPKMDDYWTVDWFARMVKPEENRICASVPTRCVGQSNRSL